MLLGADAGGPENATPTAILVMPALAVVPVLADWARMSWEQACVTAAHAAAAWGEPGSAADPVAGCCGAPVSRGAAVGLVSLPAGRPAQVRNTRASSVGEPQGNMCSNAVAARHMHTSRLGKRAPSQLISQCSNKLNRLVRSD